MSQEIEKQENSRAAQCRRALSGITVRRGDFSSAVGAVAAGNRLPHARPCNLWFISEALT